MRAEFLRRGKPPITSQVHVTQLDMQAVLALLAARRWRGLRLPSSAPEQRQCRIQRPVGTVPDVQTRTCGVSTACHTPGETCMSGVWSRAWRDAGSQLVGENSNAALDNLLGHKHNVLVSRTTVTCTGRG